MVADEAAEPAAGKTNLAVTILKRNEDINRSPKGVEFVDVDMTVRDVVVGRVAGAGVRVEGVSSTGVRHSEVPEQLGNRWAGCEHCNVGLDFDDANRALGATVRMFVARGRLLAFVTEAKQNFLEVL